ncbi:MAG TPA: zinc-ribbon domain-containing protein [Candidatus Gemmiger excrementavium]|uniref:Zinc-ribbon domain-containing protein n=1 Tax=Candidatus Gemmiger excrementavium TaxID=2838608 RepID=A0A9D2F4U1_9FIRM|nr:zinc-ribbon domain-containing protein [Candidatus Gemmiger excrementavium]
MAMDLNAKAAYIRGLMTGMEFDPASKNGKVIAAMMDLLEEMAATVTEHDNALDQVYDELETLDQDLDDLVMDLYGEDEEDGEEDEDLYEVTCPNCGAVATVDEETLMDPDQELVCPNCGAAFDIELEGTEEEEPEDPDQPDQE